MWRCPECDWTLGFRSQRYPRPCCFAHKYPVPMEVEEVRPATNFDASEQYDPLPADSPLLDEVNEGTLRLDHAKRIAELEAALRDLEAEHPDPLDDPLRVRARSLLKREVRL